MADATAYDDKPTTAKGVGGVFTKKLGPLPFWGWGLLGVGAIVLYMRYRASQTAASPSTAVPVNSAISPGTAGYAGAGAVDPLSALASQLSQYQGIQSQLQGLGSPLANPPSPAAATPAPATVSGAAAPVASPAPVQPNAPSGPTYTHIANPTVLKALPVGTAIYTLSNGTYTHVASPAALSALPRGTALYTQN